MADNLANVKLLLDCYLSPTMKAMVENEVETHRPSYPAIDKLLEAMLEIGKYLGDPNASETDCLGKPSKLFAQATLLWSMETCAEKLSEIKKLNKMALNLSDWADDKFGSMITDGVARYKKLKAVYQESVGEIMTCYPELRKLYPELANITGTPGSSASGCSWDELESSLAQTSNDSESLRWYMDDLVVALTSQRYAGEGK